MRDFEVHDPTNGWVCQAPGMVEACEMLADLAAQFVEEDDEQAALDLYVTARVAGVDCIVGDDITMWLQT